MMTHVSLAEVPCNRTAVCNAVNEIFTFVNIFKTRQVRVGLHHITFHKYMHNIMFDYTDTPKR